MAFNRKAHEIEALTNANQFLRDENQRLVADRDRLGPYDDVARDLYDGVHQEAARTEDPDTAYANAYESVRKALFEKRCEAIRLKIIDENQPLWEREIDDQIRATQGEAMAAEAREKFFAEEADHYQETAVPRIAQEIGRITRAELIAGLDEKTQERLQRHAEEKALREEERLQRLDTIREASLHFGQLDLGCLERGEVISIDFCARGAAVDAMPETKKPGFNNATVERTLKLTILEPQSGLTLVLDDSWQKDKDDLRARLAVEDNTQLTIGTLRLNGEGFIVDNDIHRGGLLHMISQDQDHSHPFEVSRIWLQDDCIL